MAGTSTQVTVERRSSLVQRLHERGVLRVAASYAIIAWLLLQIASVVFDPLGVPKWVLTALIVTAVAGFPVALALAWFLEFGPHGVTVDTAPSGAPRIVARGVRHYADAIVIGVLVVAIAVLLVRQSDFAKPKPPANPAIAVLPFENLSGDPQQEYFSDGLAEETLDRLGRVPGLRVIARSSSFRFKGKDQDVKAIAETLGVTTILEGSVRRSGMHLRLSAQLVDGATGQEMWSGSFDREMTDVFKVQAELARAVVNAIIPAARGEVAKQAPPAEADLSAYDLYLLAKATEWQRSSAGVQRTVELLERSIERDPNYAPAHAQLALSLYTAIYYAGRNPKAAREQIAQEANAAMALDPKLPASQLAQAIANEVAVPPEQTRAALARIVAGNPNYAPAMFYYSMYLGAPSDPAASRKWLEKTLAIDPLAITPRLNLIISFYAFGDTNAVARELARYEQLHASDVDGQATLARASLRYLNDPPRAVQAARRAIALSPAQPTPPAAVMLHRALLNVGDYAAADALLRGTDWSTTSPATLAYEQALAAGDQRDRPALRKAIEALRALPPDPTRDAALLLWLTVTGDCKAALGLRESAAKSPGNRNYTLAGFESDDMFAADDWCRFGPGTHSTDRKDLQEDLAETERDVKATPKSVPSLVVYAAVRSIAGDDAEAISKLERAVDRAPLAISFQPAYPWFARLQGQPTYDRLVERHLQAQAEARRQIAANGAVTPTP